MNVALPTPAPQQHATLSCEYGQSFSISSEKICELPLWEKDSWKNLVDIDSCKNIALTFPEKIDFAKDQILEFDAYKLVVKKEIHLTSHNDESGELICIENEDLGIHVYTEVETPEELIELVMEDIDFLWCDCAKEKDEKLGKGALILKQNLLSFFEEV